MRGTFSGAVLLLALGVAGWAWRSSDAEDGKPAGPPRPLSVHHLMEVFVKPHSDAIKKDLEAGPADDKAWKKIAMHVAVLNESGHMLLQGGRCPDKVWADSSKAMSEGTLVVLEKIKARDAKATMESYVAMKKASCAACHDKHKPPAQ